MSRIGKQPVILPPKVLVEISARKVTVKGPKGKLCFDLPDQAEARLDGSQLLVTRNGDDASARAMHGLCRSIISNMVSGVYEGYSKRLEIHGVGFKAAVQGRKVNLQLGYSHPIAYALPEQINVTVEENTKLLVEGPDKQAVGQVAADLRAFYPPEPYKGKGVRYVGEKIIRKEGKTVQ